MTSPKLQKHKYVTRKAHGKHPAGTECLAWRDQFSFYSSTVCLEFEDETIELDGHKWFLEGIEYNNYFSEQIAKEIDE
jgi:hypothetical protein